MTANAILSLLEPLGKLIPQKTKHKQSYRCCCPAHADKDPSLVVTELHDGRVLLKCWAGCGATDVLDALNADWSILYPIEENMTSVFGPRPKNKKTSDDYLIAVAEADIKAGKRLTAEEKMMVIQAKINIKNRDKL